MEVEEGRGVEVAGTTTGSGKVAVADKGSVAVELESSLVSSIGKGVGLMVGEGWQPINQTTHTKQSKRIISLLITPKLKMVV